MLDLISQPPTATHRSVELTHGPEENRPDIVLRALRRGAEIRSVSDARIELAQAYSFRRVQREMRELLVTRRATVQDTLTALAEAHHTLTGDAEGRAILLQAAAEFTVRDGEDPDTAA